MRTLLHIVNLMRNRVTRSLYGQLNNEQSNERVMFDCRTVKNRMTGSLCSFALLRPTERTEIFMKSIIQIPRIPLFNEIEEPQSYAIYIFGTDNRLLQDADTFGDALARYLNEYGITQDMFARMTGISQCTISRYLKNERKIRQRYLCAVCIALRLHPFRQRHLFFKSDNLIPGTYGFKNQADYILCDYLNGCAYNESYTLMAYNDRMKKLGLKPLTSLTSDMEGGK